jgi:hypothetical protein
MVGFARVAMVGGCLLALAACGRGAGSTADDTTPSTTVQPASTTAAPSTTSAPTTTLSPQAQDEADIRELHDRFFRMLLRSSSQPDPNDIELNATVTGIQHQRWTEHLQTVLASGEHYEGDLRSVILTIDLMDADHAAVRDCTTDASVRVDAGGELVEKAAGESVVTELRLLRIAEGWRVEDWYTGGADPCG